jgi:hypothetical protein
VLFVLRRPSARRALRFRSSIDALTLVDPVAVHINGVAEGIDGRAEFLQTDTARRLPDLVLPVHAALHAVVVVAKRATEHRRQLLLAPLGRRLRCALPLPHCKQTPQGTNSHLQATQPPLLTTLPKTNSHGNTAPPTIAKWRATEDTELGKWLKWEARTLIGFAARASLPLSPPELQRGAWIVRG